MNYFIWAFIALIVLILIIGLWALSKPRPMGRVFTDEEKAKRLEAFEKTCKECDEIDFSFNLLKLEHERLFNVTTTEPNANNRLANIKTMQGIRDEMEKLLEERKIKLNQLEQWK